MRIPVPPSPFTGSLVALTALAFGLALGLSVPTPASAVEPNAAPSQQVEPMADVIVDEELPPPDLGDESETTTIEISTIPPLVGVVVQIDDQTSTTDDDGIARFRTDRRANLRQRITVVSAEIDNQTEGYRASFARLYRLDSRNYALAFDLHLPLTFSFAGSNGETIPPGDIDVVNLKNSLGGIRPDIPLDAPIWVHAQRVVSTQRGPELRDIEWSIDSVLVRESNVVNRAQVRFLPAFQPHIAVPLLFFSATFRIHDMFFNTAAGSSIELTYPDDTVQTHPLDDDGVLHIGSLPRGEYHAVVIGSGPKISRPVALSRNQDLELEFLSWLDIGLVVALVGLFVSLPVLVGRRLLHKRAAPTPAHQPEPKPNARPNLVPVPQPANAPQPSPVPSPVPTPDPTPSWPPPAATAPGVVNPSFARILIEPDGAAPASNHRSPGQHPPGEPGPDPSRRPEEVAVADQHAETTIIDLTAFADQDQPSTGAPVGLQAGDPR